MGLGEAIGNAILDAIGRKLAGLGVWAAHGLVAISYSVALVGGGILILMYVAGYRKGLRYTGILFISHVLIRYLIS